MTLYVSALHLDAHACRQLRITDGYSLHRVVYSLYDDVRSEQQKQGSVPSGIQWVDKGGDSRGRKILMMADRPPHEPQAGCLETRLLSDSFLSHSCYRFSVCLNPTRRHAQTGKQSAITGRAAILSWFCQRAEGWGFNVDPRQVQVESINVLKMNMSPERIITLQQATVSGRLTVSHTENFRKSFMQGIGRARAFGCGLLQIVPQLEYQFFDE